VAVAGAQVTGETQRMFRVKMANQGAISGANMVKEILRSLHAFYRVELRHSNGIYGNSSGGGGNSNNSSFNLVRMVVRALT
jgi:hypothetical protein